MALSKDKLQTGIEDALKAGFEPKDLMPDVVSGIQKAAKGLAEAIHAYVIDAEVGGITVNLNAAKTQGTQITPVKVT